MESWTPSPTGHGVWYTADALSDPSKCRRRHAAASAAAAAWLNQARDPAEQALGIHAFLPSTVPCVALCTRVRGRIEAIGSASILRDAQGACLVTAAHTLIDAEGVYASIFRDEGLVALARSGARCVLMGRTWSVFQDRDVAFTPLTDEEASDLGDAAAIAYSSAPAALWVAFGFPNSANQQRHRTAAFAVNLFRIILYHDADHRGLEPWSRAWRLDRKDAFNPDIGQQGTMRSLRGCSDGLIAAYHPSLGCWLPEAIFTEYHHIERRLVGTHLSTVFGPQS